MNSCIRHIYYSLLYKNGTVRQTNDIINIDIPYRYDYTEEHIYIIDENIKPIAYGNPVNIRKNKWTTT